MMLRHSTTPITTNRNWYTTNHSRYTARLILVMEEKYFATAQNMSYVRFDMEEKYFTMMLNFFS
jgi:hypothetical protein